jgi:uncharacterized protein YijF (DUF1287 family)
MAGMDRRTLLQGLAALGVASPFVLERAAAQTPDEDLPFNVRIAIGAERRAAMAETYDASYQRLAYPMGDVADDRGVCADTVIRAFRHAGVDLQVEVHEDMRANFASYPDNWGLRRPDRNIDHRRVPNLETLFRRRGGARRFSQTAGDYHAGDVVSWRLTGTTLPHIGIVTRAVKDGEPLVAHNIGRGTQMEPVLFAWPMSGWFRFDRWA